MRAGGDAVQLVVTATDAVAEILSPVVNGTYYSDQKLTFEGLVSDTEDDPDTLLVTWESDIDGVVDVANEPNGSGELLGAEYLSEGEHFLTLTVEDGTGKVGTDNVTLTVGGQNSIPLCEITEPATGAGGAENALVTFIGTVSDVDVPANLLSVEWAKPNGALGSSTPNSSGEVSFPFSDLTVNTHVVSMTVTDEVGGQCVDDIIYTVGSAPTILLVSPTNGGLYSRRFPSASMPRWPLKDGPQALTMEWEFLHRRRVLNHRPGFKRRGPVQRQQPDLRRPRHHRHCHRRHRALCPGHRVDHRQRSADRAHCDHRP